jgi:uncharacterized DUF497 family protein
MTIFLFQWDIDTADHIAAHGVSPDEVEEVAFDDEPHVRRGEGGRRYLYGRTGAGRLLFIVYVHTGQGLAKVITARDMDDKERRLNARQRK